MKILAVRSNPRKNGYTQRITDLVVSGARDAGADITDIDLTAKKITPCIGCYHCWTVTPGVCRFKDDMPGLLEHILQTDIVLCSTPLYYYSTSAIMKIFIERTLPLTKQGFELGRSGLMRNLVRFPERWRDKRLAYITTGAFRETENFSGIAQTFKLLADGMDMNLCGAITRPESYLLQFELAKPKSVKTVETALVRAGLELATQGSISDDTSKKASIPLAIDTPHFLTYSNIYLEHAMALGKDSQDLELVQRTVVGDVRILMREMARSVDRGATAKLKAVFQFDFPDKGYHFRISVDHGECSLEQTESARCDLRVTTSTDVWAGVFTRQTNIRNALMSKKIVLEGDKSLFTRLDRYFPPPVA